MCQQPRKPEASGRRERSPGAEQGFGNFHAEPPVPSQGLLILLFESLEVICLWTLGLEVFPAQGDGDFS